jgi:L-seryl-tRNA(Ser) seleniumtransferase
MAAQPSKQERGKQPATALLRRLPSVEKVCALAELLPLVADKGYGRGFIARAVAVHLDEIRAAVRAGELDAEGLEARLDDLPGGVMRAAAALAAPHLRPVINATGVVVHTNLGRSPWPPAAMQATALAGRYLNLELDLEDGGRGQRAVAIERLVGELLDGAAAAVVNNNAAAVLLVLNTLAEGKEVVVSRGQLVEIGGSFRIPEVMAKSQSILREVGTTNRTRLADFDAAIGPHTGALLSVHPSNYRVVGFTEEVDLADLVALGAERGIAVVEDLGSGCLIDPAELGISGEPGVGQRLATGVDLVTFSGDKLLGGPQAGFIVGKPDHVRRVRSNPLYRALRIDKATTLALEATLAAYLTGRHDDIPTLAMLRATPKALEARAKALRTAIQDRLGGVASDPLRRSAPDGGRAEPGTGRRGDGSSGRFSAATIGVVPVHSQVGGGAAPGHDLPSFALAIDWQAGPDDLMARLRAAEPPIIARILDDRVVLDVRTILPDEDDLFARAIVQVLAEKTRGDRVSPERP